tara:strand:- start:4112 stop:4333 length:222 start_codon:yes stop_codon:yes gene_type:complete
MASEFTCPECGGKGTMLTGHKTAYRTQLICDVDECSWEAYARNPQGRNEKATFDPIAKMHEILGTTPTGDGEE